MDSSKNRLPNRMDSSNKNNNNRRTSGRHVVPNEDLESGVPAGLQRKTSKQKREEREAAMRRRSMSNGATLGAFFHEPKNDAPQGPRPRRRTSRRSSQQGAGGAPLRQSTKPKSGIGTLQKSTSEQNYSHPMPSAGDNIFNSSADYNNTNINNNNNTTGSDLGDMASMAIAGLGDFDFSDVIGGQGSPLMTGAGTASKKAPVTSAPAPATRRIPRPGMPIATKSSGSQLETIHDDSEAHLDGSTPEYSRKTRNQLARKASGGPQTRRARDSRVSTNTVDSLRVSDVSEDEIGGFLKEMDRDNSMFVSDSSFGDLDGFGVDGSSHRQSLFGTNIFDKESTGSLYQMNHDKKSDKGARRATSEEEKGPGHKKVPSQKEEIANFAAMLHADYGASHPVETLQSAEPSHPLKGGPTKPNEEAIKPSVIEDMKPPLDEVSIDESISDVIVVARRDRFLHKLDPTEWLTKDVEFNEDGIPYFKDGSNWTPQGIIRHLLYNPISPEFTSLQQFSWAIVIGVLMGFYTAFWKEIIEHSVEFMWKELPEALLEWGFFTELDGSFPLYHYMWICPAFWGGILSYIFAALPTPIPGQNEWIQNVHTMGVQDAETFPILFVLSTLGMASGLSLGPELPLVLTAGMIGSWLGVICKQSVLQARVMNITAAGAAIGGFFGFPMAGALFVMEIPHRMGLQYFEALSPSTISSIVAVLCNRLLMQNDVTGYYNYPFLTNTLPSYIFTSAIIFGLFGCLVGVTYCRTVLFLKGWVHDFFHAPHGHNEEESDNGEDGGGTADSSNPSPESIADMIKDNGENGNSEMSPLLTNGHGKNSKISAPKEAMKDPLRLPWYKKLHQCLLKYVCFVIPYEPYRAGAAGVVAGTMVGVICMFVPHVLFWGEAQLQSLIDKGKTPLPIFGQEDEPTAALTALGYCMIDPNDAAAIRKGFSVGCSFLISFSKIVVTGLSLGTGIIGGHFWGPLFTGCAASHFLQDVVKIISSKTGYLTTLGAYPCVTILCMMGSTHVVTFRAHIAIMLILTLTIRAFDPEDENGGGATAGDYSAVFPLLVVSVFVSLMVSRRTVFYNTQRSRVDIMALPEVLCEPGKAGMPMVMGYSGGYSDIDSDYDYSDEGDYEEEYLAGGEPSPNSEKRNMVEQNITQEDIEKEFTEKNVAMAVTAPPHPLKPDAAEKPDPMSRRVTSESAPRSRGASPLPPRPQDRRKINSEGGAAIKSTGSDDGGSGTPTLGGLSSARLDELLAAPLENARPTKPSHRRIHSAPNVDFGVTRRFEKQRSGHNILDDKSLGGESGGGGGGGRHQRSDSFGSQASGKVMRVTTIGKLSEDQPSLMEQARLRSATSVLIESRHIRHPSMPTRMNRGRHSRNNSTSSLGLGNDEASPPLTVQAAVDKMGLPKQEVERAYTSALHRERIESDGNRTADGSARKPTK